MSKLTKLIKNPKLFFVDSYHKRKKILVDSYTGLKNKNAPRHIGGAVETPEIKNIVDMRRTPVEVEQPTLDMSAMRAFYRSLLPSNPPFVSNFVLAKHAYNRLIYRPYDLKEFDNRLLFRSELACHDQFMLTLSSFLRFKLFNNLKNAKVGNFGHKSDDISKMAELHAAIFEDEIDSIGDFKTNKFLEHFLPKSSKKSYGAFIKELTSFFENNMDINPYVMPVVLGSANMTTLNSTATNSLISKFYISNYMWFEANRKNFQGIPIGNAADFYWWWVTSFLPEKQLSYAFIPEEIIAFYNQTVFYNQEANIYLNRFFMEVYERSDFYRGCYNLGNPVDCLGFAFDVYINNCNNAVNKVFIENSDIQSILLKPFDFSGEEMSINMMDIFSYITKTNDYSLQKISKQVLRGLHPMTDVNGHSIENKENKEWLDVVLIGLYYSNTGLANNLKMMSQTLRTMNISHDIYDIDTKKTIRIEADEPIAIKRKCNIFMINADMIPSRMFAVPQDSDTINIGFLLWELEEIPNNHKLALEFLDRVWVPTEYLRTIYEKAKPHKVSYVGKYIDLIAPTKSYVKSRYFRFYMSFDFHSNIERKNPLAAVLAFKKAFPKNKDVQFVLKTTDIIRNHPGNHKMQWERIIQEISGDSRFVIIAKKLPFQDLVNQIYNTECIVSSHRSEGFGYLPAHGFLLGKPCIVTDYSGTADFCNDSTAYPVKWNKLSIQEGDFGVVEKGFWADVDIDDMADKMLYVYRNYDSALAKAQRGKRMIQEWYSLSAFVSRCASELRQLEVIE